MRRRVCILIVLAALAAVPLSAASGASAATQVGSSCIGDRAQSGVLSLVALSNPTNPAAVSIPQAGVITKWSVSVIPYPGGISESLKVLRPVAGLDTFSVVGESTMQQINSGTNNFETRVPVQAGDRIGVTSNFEAIFCEELSGTNVMGFSTSSASLGSSVTFAEESEAQPAITATVEPDADGDGYGDETQDKCPTNAATHEACPAPPAPITLSTSTAAKKGLVIVTLTASAQASVTVGGTVKVGGAKVKLSGGTQTVTPGTLAKFTVLFPAKLKKQLKKTPPSKKLTLELSASAPGATTAAFKVKVKGQMKAKKKPHKS